MVDKLHANCIDCMNYYCAQEYQNENSSLSDRTNCSKKSFNAIDSF